MEETPGMHRHSLPIFPSAALSRTDLIALLLQMIFAMQELPGEFTSFDFIPGIPAPFNFALAILTNQKMLSFTEKLQTAKPLLPMLLYGQDFIDQQDEFSVAEFMKKYDMPDRISDEIFVAMSKALDFIDPG